MVQNATVITGYRTYPHVDTYETGARCGRTVLRSLKGEVNPQMVWAKLPMITHTLCRSPTRQPMKDIMDKSIAAEAGANVLNASIFGGFPMADIPYVGLSAHIAADGDISQAERLRDALLEMAWERRADFVFNVKPVAGSIARAKKLEGDPIVLVDHGDNVFSGGTQDAMETVAEALKQGLSNMAVVLSGIRTPLHGWLKPVSALM